MTNIEEFEKVYSKPGAIWTMEEPPQILKELIEAGVIKPCKTLDIACGEGTYGIYLAKHGFEVTGIDFSKKAIGYAEQNARNAQVKINFQTMDAQDLAKLGTRFDFAFEWGLLHHLDQDHLEEYIFKVPEVLRKEALYLTASFNIESAVYGSPGERQRKTPIGTKLFYRSQEELRMLFDPHFEIVRQEIVLLAGKGVSQPGNLFLMRKK